MSRYSGQIFANNAQLAEALNGAGTFAHVKHPRRHIGAPDWVQAPFCVLQLRDNKVANYRGLADHIMEEARRRRIKLDQGGSFGFLVCDFNGGYAEGFWRLAAIVQTSFSE